MTSVLLSHAGVGALKSNHNAAAAADQAVFLELMGWDGGGVLGACLRFFPTISPTFSTFF